MLPQRQVHKGRMFARWSGLNPVGVSLYPVGRHMKMAGSVIYRQHYPEFAGVGRILICVIKCRFEQHSVAITKAATRGDIEL